MTRCIGSGRALRTWARATACITVVVGLMLLFSERGVRMGGGVVGGEDEGAVAIPVATPSVGVVAEGSSSPSATLLLSSCRLLLLTRSLLLLPVL